MLEEIVYEFSQFDEVEAILLGGSRATSNFDEKSDYDLYVYLNKSLSEVKRKAVLDKYCSYIEYSNRFWELEDDGILNNGIEIEMIYRDIFEIDNILHKLCDNHIVNHGYSSCFLDNVLKSKILYDINNRLLSIKEKYRNGLTKELSKSIIDYNLPIIYDQVPALYKQIEKAVFRDDLHSINHRLTEYFNIFYDILFALNKVTHPGEKRLLEHSRKLEHKPKNLEELVTNIFKNAYHDNILMLKNLKELSISIKNLVTQNY